MGHIVNINVERLFKKLASDVGLDSRTVFYCIRRFRNEGVQFFTVTLPTLSKAILHSLETGETFDRPTSFQWKERSLRHFRSLLKGIFNQKTGEILADVCPVCLYGIRQLCEYFYKLVLKFSTKQELTAEEQYLQTEESVRNFSPSDEWVKSLRKTISKLFPDLDRVTIEDVFGHYRPRYTKGSFSGSNMQRIDYYLYKQLPDGVVGTTIEDFKGISGFFKPYPSSPTKVDLVAKDTCSVAEVLFVPKDSRGPRVISKEPMHQLRLQMSFFDWFSKYLENSTKKRINFADQTVNRELARTSSISKKYATLDLKEASDRISYKLCSRVFQHIPVLRYFITKRSTHYRLPSGKTGRMAKLSGMGSGLTFSCLAFLSYVSVVTHLCERTPKRLHSYIYRNVYVYGDDIVVPSVFTQMAAAGLVKSGLMVNTTKSYFRSHFRESCGGDYYYGNDVGPARLRLQNAAVNFLAAERSIHIGSHSAGVLELERHCRELIRKGLYNTADFIYSVLESRLGKLPNIAGESPALGRYCEYGTDYQPDDNGNYGDVLVTMPAPVQVSSIGLCPYKALANSLRPREVSSLAYLYPDDGNLGDGVSVPRRVRLYKQKVSAYRLMG